MRLSKFIESTFLVVTTVFLSACAKDANLSLPTIFSNNMVLQQNSNAAIWGKATPGTKVTVTGDWGATASAKAAVDSTWLLNLPTRGAGGPYALRVTANKTAITINNVLLGEVWLASGQSNMEMPLAGWPPKDPIMNSEATITTSDNSEIRMFTVLRNTSAVPLEDVSGDWQLASPETAGRFSATAYFFARKLNQELRVPIGIIHSSWGGTPAEAWVSGKMLTIDKDFSDAIKQVEELGTMNNDSATLAALSLTLSAHTPSALFNAMIAPLTPYSLKGAIWYQGESNVGRAHQYMRLKSMLVTDWRNQFNNPDFSFYYVQLAPWHYNDVKGTSSANLREAQRRMMDLANTGMISTLDIGNVDNIHPANKTDVGERLALWALAKNYQRDIPFSGPIPTDKETLGNALHISFKHTVDALIINETVPNQFEIAGKDGVFHPAQTLVKGDTLILSSKNVTAPVNARYAYKNGSVASLFNSAGLPAPSFSTEDEIAENQ